MANHNDGFKLMKYRAEDGSCEEWIWNSRDGVCPFMATLSNGKTAMHVDWNLDQYFPDYNPPIGSVVFITATEALLLPKVEDYVDKYWDHGDYPMRDSFKDKDEAKAMLLAEWCGDGDQPMQIKVDEKFLRELADQRSNRN